MLQIYTMSTVWGEPLSQTAQSFMPELLFGINRNLPKVGHKLSVETIYLHISFIFLFYCCLKQLCLYCCL